MNEDRFSVYQTPTGSVWIRDSVSPTGPDVLYVSYSEIDNKPGPVNALDYARSIADALNSVSGTHALPALQKV